MFQFRRFPSIRYGLAYGCMRVAHAGFPIQISPDHWIFAPPRSFSQLITSFIGSKCQGIHPALFFAWPFRSYSVNIWRLVLLGLFLFLRCISTAPRFVSILRFTYFRCFVYAVFKVHSDVSFCNAMTGRTLFWRLRASHSLLSIFWLFYQPFKHKSFLCLNHW